jgi:hypothetical protein
VALYINVEAGQAMREKVEQVNQVILDQIWMRVQQQLPKAYWPSESCYSVQESEQKFQKFLFNWCSSLDKPLVLFMDEIDSLIGDSLLSVLRQLRGSYDQRPQGAPQSVALIGLRDVRDYRIHSSSSKELITGGSAFNIKDESLVLDNFTAAQVRQLMLQHTDATGQRFEEAALDKIFDYTQGQPWLTNALGKVLCFGMTPVAEGKTITVQHVEKAKEVLILRRDVHLDQLADKLTEPRVAAIIETILTGDVLDLDQKASTEDLQYVKDLGLVRVGDYGLEIANPIYREVIPRELTLIMQESIGQKVSWYVTPEGRLNIQKVLEAFIKFYKEHAEMLTRRKTYNEAAHHLLFMAWLQRIVNGGGTIQREYAAGIGRLDLCIEFAQERFVFELKINKASALEDGKEQLTDYLNRLSMDLGYLVLFTRSKIDDWSKIGFADRFIHQGKTIQVIQL